MAQRLSLFSYQNQLHKCHLNRNEPKRLKVGSEWSDSITFTGLDPSFEIYWDGDCCNIGDKLLCVNESLTLKHQDDFIHLYLKEENDWCRYDITQHGSITIGANDYDDITLTNTTVDLVLIREQLGDPFKLEVYNGQVYHNFVRVTGDVVLEAGDQLFFAGVMVKMGQDSIEVLGSERIKETKLIRLFGTVHGFDSDYPDYHRSPRIIYREPTDKRRIAKLSNKPGKPSDQLARVIVPPLVMIAAMVVVSIFQSNGFYIFVMLAMTITTIIFSVTSYVKSWKKYRADIKERDRSYRDYLKQKTHELYKVSEEQRHALHYHYPNVKQIRDMARNVHSRIYEKTMFHHDFLTWRVGLGRVDSSFGIEFNIEEFTLEKDELVEAASRLRSQYLTLEDVPVVTSLMKGPVGYGSDSNGSGNHCLH